MNSGKEQLIERMILPDEIAEEVDAEKDKPGYESPVQVDPEEHDGREQVEQVPVPVMIGIQQVIPD